MKKIYLLLLLSILFTNYINSQVLWSAPAGQAWLINTNWTGNVIPTTTEIAQFGINPTGGLGIGINMNDPTNNGANNQAVGAVEITNARSSNLLIGNSSTSAAGTLTLNGTTVNGVANVILRNNSTGLLTIDNTQALGNQTMLVALGNTTDNRIYIDNSGGVTINTVVSGTGRALSIYGTGSGIVQLNAANTYTGLTTVAASTLQLNNTGGGTLLATNDIVINTGGTLRVSANQTINNLTLNAGGFLIIDNGITLTINGTFLHYGGNINLNISGKIDYSVGAGLGYLANFAQTTSDAEFPAVNGPSNLTIDNVNGVTLHASRILSNVLSMPSGNLVIGNNNITANLASGSVGGTHVVTNGTGKLILTNIGATTKIFPVGHDAVSINQIAISNGTNINYGVRVVEGFPFPIFLPFYAVNRTWFVEAASTPAGMVNVDFYYSNGHGNGGFTYTTNVDLGIYTTVWNIPQTNIPTIGTYQVPTSVGAFQGGIPLPMVIGNLGAILNTPRLVDLSAQKINNTAQLNWTNNTSAVFKEVVVERSANGRNFETLTTVLNSSLSYTDNQLLAGTNYYRIKLTDINGRISYSAIAAIINSATGFDIVGLMPNIVNTTAQLNIASAKKTPVNVVVTDMAGRTVLKQFYNAVAGSNLFTVNVAALAAGVYNLTAVTATGGVQTVKFIKQ